MSGGSERFGCYEGKKGVTVLCGLGGGGGSRGCCSRRCIDIYNIYRILYTLYFPQKQNEFVCIVACRALEVSHLPRS